VHPADAAVADKRQPQLLLAGSACADIRFFRRVGRPDDRRRGENSRAALLTMVLTKDRREVELPDSAIVSSPWTYGVVMFMLPAG